MRPKRTTKGKEIPTVVSIMASMDEETRHRFTERVNRVAKSKEAVRQEQITQQLAQEKKRTYANINKL